MNKSERKILVDRIVEELKLQSNPRAVEGMTRFGITPRKTYGVSIPDLRKIAKKIGKNHELAQELWGLDIRESRILASMVDEPTLVTKEQMDKWVRDFDYWEICDQVCQNLFTYTNFACEKCVEWATDEQEFVKRAGFALMAWLAFKDKKTDDKEFEKFLPRIKKTICDDRIYVKKAVNWALRQIGKRNLHLNKKAIETAKEIQKIDSKNAKWIASDAIGELTSEAIQERLKKGGK